MSQTDFRKTHPIFSKFQFAGHVQDRFLENSLKYG